MLSRQQQQQSGTDAHVADHRDVGNRSGAGACVDNDDNFLEFWQPSSTHTVDLSDSAAFCRTFESILVSLGLKKVGMMMNPLGSDLIGMGPMDAKQQIGALEGELTASRSQLQAIKGDREHEMNVLANMYKNNTVKASELQSAKAEADRLKESLESIIAHVGSFASGKPLASQRGENEEMVASIKEPDNLSEIEGLLRQIKDKLG